MCIYGSFSACQKREIAQRGSKTQIKAVKFMFEGHEDKLSIVCLFVCLQESKLGQYKPGIRVREKRLGEKGNERKLKRGLFRGKGILTLKEIFFRAEINAGLLKLSRPLLSASMY